MLLSHTLSMRGSASLVEFYPVVKEDSGTDRLTDGLTDGRTDGGVNNIPIAF